MRISRLCVSLGAATAMVVAAVGTAGGAQAASVGHAATHAAATHAAAHRGDVMLPGGTAGHLTPVSKAAPGGAKVVTHDTSDNWSGFAATGGTYTSVSSSWTQPSATCGSGDTYSSFWVGLDGDGTQSVEQTGTEADCSGGSPSYYGWYEMYPAYPVNYGNPVSPGDSMTASVSAGGSTFTLTLTDNTAGWTKTTTQSSSSAQLGSAEVIAEAPYSDGVLPLTDFGTVDFTDSTVNGSPLGDTSPDRIDLVSDGGTTEATTSSLDGSGENFSVAWDSSGD